jgi:hypothetical protein
MNIMLKLDQIFLMKENQFDQFGAMETVGQWWPIQWIIQV